MNLILCNFAYCFPKKQFSNIYFVVVVVHYKLKIALTSSLSTGNIPSIYSKIHGKSVVQGG